MSASQITVLKLRQLKPCGPNRILNSIPAIQGFAERMFQFDVKIPTKLWGAILRRRKLVADGHITSLTLSQARTENDIDIRYEAETFLDLLNTRSTVRYNMPGAVYVAPVDAELFDRFHIRVLRCVVLFRSPTIINFNVTLCGVGGLLNREVIFDVSYFPDILTVRPPGALVSYTINI